MVTATKKRTRADDDEIPPEPSETVEPVAEAETLPAVIEPPEPPSKIISTLKMGTMTERGFVPRGSMVSVRCDVFDGLEDFFVRYNLSVTFRVMREDYTGPGDSPLEGECRKMAAMIAGFDGWRFVDPLTDELIPVPDHDDWESWKCICSPFGMLGDLYFWLVSEGYSAAIKVATGN